MLLKFNFPIYCNLFFFYLSFSKELMINLNDLAKDLKNIVYYRPLGRLGRGVSPLLLPSMGFMVGLKPGKRYWL